MATPIVIAGGGLAGLACGIRLREAGWPVVLHERGAYPLKKVCGEFLSPLGWQRLLDLGVLPYLPMSPASLKRVRFYASDHDYVDFDLEPAAYGLSRLSLDAALARRFQDLGGDLRENSAYEGEADGRTVLDARGKPPLRGQSPWLGWKGYLLPGQIPEELQVVDLVMLPVTGGYCGLSRIEDGRLNVCLVARAPAAIPALLGSHPLLARVAGHLDPFAAIASFDFRAHSEPGRIGDRRHVWPPLVGDGMSRALGGGMAQAQALLEGRPLKFEAWPSGYAMAQGLHWMMLEAWRRRVGLALTRAWPGLPQSLFRDTRG